MTWGSTQISGAYQGRPKSSCARYLYEYRPIVKPPAGVFSVTKAGHYGARERTEPRSGRAFELALLGDPLMRLGHALDAVLLLIAIGREQTHHFVNAVGATAPEHPRREVNTVPDTESVWTQDCILRHSRSAWPASGCPVSAPA